MKIDKILFSLSDHPDYQGFWELQSKIWKEHLGVEPVCLFFNKDRNGYRPSEEHGTVIDYPIDPDVPWSLQLTMSKFHFPATEPDTTWFIGDIDMLPLQRPYFTTHIQDVPDDEYAHLNAGGLSCVRVGRNEAFIQGGSTHEGGCDLPGHYHLAKGSTFERVINRGKSMKELVKEIVAADTHGMGPDAKRVNREPNPDEYWYYWCAEESRTSELIWAAMNAGQCKFRPSYYHNGHDHDRINRDSYDVNAGYRENREKLRNGGFVDIHCARPFPKQAEQLQSILDEVWK